MKYLHLLANPTYTAAAQEQAAPDPAQSMSVTSPLQGKLSRPDPSDHRETVVETHLRLDRLAVPQSASQLKAMELVRTCREFGVGLRLDPDGTLVVVSNGKAWRSLVKEIELHIDAVAELIMAGWDSTDA